MTFAEMSCYVALPDSEKTDMEIIRGSMKDFASIRSFYDHVIDNTEGMEHSSQGR